MLTVSLEGIFECKLVYLLVLTYILKFTILLYIIFSHVLLEIRSHHRLSLYKYVESSNSKKKCWKRPYGLHSMNQVVSSLKEKHIGLV